MTGVVPQKPVLEGRDLTKHFHVGGFFSPTVVKAVQGSSLSLYPGYVVALVGESGSGKSTIIRMLARLYEPTSGEIYYEGEPVFHNSNHKRELDYRRKVQMIFQDPFSSLNPVKRVGYHLERPMILHHKMHKKEALRRSALELLQRVALTPPEEYIEKYPHQLSGGQRQRVAIARTLAVSPRVILADEPISMLDVSIRLDILNLMEALRRDMNIAFLYVTHDIASARYFADEINVMYAGYIVEKANSEELIQEPKHPYTQMLLSSVPDPHRGLRTGEGEVAGEIPDLTTLGKGCPFAPRCKHAMDVCQESMPPRTQLSETRWVRCYLY